MELRAWRDEAERESPCYGGAGLHGGAEGLKESCGGGAEGMAGFGGANRRGRLGVDTDLKDRDGGDKDNTVLDRTGSDYKDKSVLD